MDRGGTADTVGGMGANRDTDVSNTLRKTRTLEHALERHGPLQHVFEKDSSTQEPESTGP